jgi:hypothetical protein
LILWIKNLISNKKSQRDNKIKKLEDAFDGIFITKDKILNIKGK